MTTSFLNQSFNCKYRSSDQLQQYRNHSRDNVRTPSISIPTSVAQTRDARGSQRCTTEAARRRYSGPKRTASPRKRARQVSSPMTRSRVTLAGMRLSGLRIPKELKSIRRRDCEGHDRRFRCQGDRERGFSAAYVTLIDQQHSCAKRHPRAAGHLIAKHRHRQDDSGYLNQQAGA